MTIEKQKRPIQRIIEEFKNNSVLNDASYEVRQKGSTAKVVKYKPSTGEEIHIEIPQDTNSNSGQSGPNS